MPQFRILFLLLLLVSSAVVMAGPGVWTSAGPTGGDVREVVVDPDTPGTVYLTSVNSVYKSTDTGLNWTRLNVSPYAASLYRLRMDPFDSDVLMVSATSRAYRSDDAGASWTAMAGGLPIPGMIYDIAFDPHTAGRVWLASEGVLYQSNDLGQTWAPVAASGLPVSIHQIIVDPDVAGRMLMIGSDPVLGGELLRSTDAGLTWTPVTYSGTPPSINAFWGRRIAYLADPDDLVFAANGSHLFRSQDGGLQFTQLPAISLPGARAIQSVTADPGNSESWLIGLENGLIRTTNGGVSYSEIGAGIQPVAGGYSNGVLDLALDPVTATTLYAGANHTGFFVSLDNGISWMRRNNGLRQASIRAFAVHPSQPQWLYAGYGDAFTTPSDGLFRSVDRGGSWFTASPTLEASGLRSLFIDGNTAANPFSTTMYAAGYGAPLYAADGNVRDGNAGVFKSSDGGTTWATIDNGIPFETIAGPMGPYRRSHFAIARTVVADPSSGGAPGGTGPLQTLYLSGSGRITYDFGTGAPTVVAARIYKSTDAGANWAAADAGLPIPDFNLTHLYAHTVQAVPLVIDPSNTNTLYVGTFSSVPGTSGTIPEPTISEGVVNGVFKSTDGGTNWLHSSTGLPRLQDGNPDSPHRSVLALAVAPSQPNTLYAAVHRDLFDSRVYKSTNAGASWFEATTGIAPDADIRALLVDPDDADIVFAGSAGSEVNPGGVYRSTDGGVSWTSYSIGLPSSAALALTLDKSATVPRLYAGTRNGVFEIDQVPDEDSDGVPNQIEAAGPSGGDGNGDGIPDTVQEYVASLPGAGDPGRGGDAYVSVELVPVVGACSRLENTHVLSADQFPSDPLHEYGFGLTRMDIGDCQQAQLKFIYHGNTSGQDWGFRLFAPVAPDQPYTYAWRDFPATRDGNVWTVNVIDNALGDLRAAEDAILFQGGIARSGQIFAYGFE